MHRLTASILLGLGILVSMASLAESEPAAPATDEVTRAIIAATSNMANLEKAGGPFSARLFDPLISIARLYIESGQFDKAEDALRRAQNISHRHAGVYAPAQLEAVQLLTDLAVRQGAFDSADRQQRFALFVITRHFGRDSADALHAHADLARWYLRTGQPRRARSLLRETMAQVKAQVKAQADRQPADSLNLAVLMVQARRLQGLCCNTSDITSALTETQAGADVNPDTLAAAYLTLADSYTLGRKPELAADYYRQAFETAPITGAGAPQLITIKRQINQYQQGRVEFYKVPGNPFARRDALGRPVLQRMTQAEELNAAAQAPRWFIVDADNSHRNFKVPDTNDTLLSDQRPQALAGSPLKFSQAQLNHILPRGAADYRIELTFSVQATGVPRHIGVTSSNAPAKLNRLLVAALQKIHFRPQLNQGRPVDTHGVVLVQTFDADGD